MEGDEHAMNMNGIQGAGPTPQGAPLRPADDSSASGAPKAQGRKTGQADRIEISERGRAMASDGAADRQGKVEAARKRLESGELFSPEAHENAAKNLLRSGQLRATDDE